MYPKLQSSQLALFINLLPLVNFFLTKPLQSFTLAVLNINYRVKDDLFKKDRNGFDDLRVHLGPVVDECVAERSQLSLSSPIGTSH